MAPKHSKTKLKLSQTIISVFARVQFEILIYCSSLGATNLVDDFPRKEWKKFRFLNGTIRIRCQNTSKSRRNTKPSRQAFPPTFRSWVTKKDWELSPMPTCHCHPICFCFFMRVSDRRCLARLSEPIYRRYSIYNPIYIRNDKIFQLINRPV